MVLQVQLQAGVVLVRVTESARQVVQLQAAAGRVSVAAVGDVVRVHRGQVLQQVLEAAVVVVLAAWGMSR